MKFISTFALILFLSAFSVQIWAQDLSIYQWKNRLVVVKTKSHFDKQQAIFNSHSKAVEERKLKLVFKKDFSHPSKANIFLIGLDGGVKFKSNGIIPISKLNSLIDVMPMRIQEIQ